MKAISAATMRQLDARTIAAGTPGEVLMERAGEGAYEALIDFMDQLDPAHVKRVAIVTGKGNNGGDGHVIARLLDERTDLPVRVYSVVPINELTGDALANARRVREFHVCDRLPDEVLKPGTVLVDALLGTGITGEVREPYATLIEQMNASGLPIMAVDIPSGVNADTGAVANVAVRADLTVTMALPKTGLVRGAGALRVGRLRCVDIGIPAAFVAEADSPFEVFLAADARPLLPRLPADTHKGRLGRIAVVGGSANYPGAPLLCGRAAMRAGGGLVTVAYPRSIAPLLRPPENALILAPVEDGGVGYHHDFAALTDLVARQDVLAVGPGLGQDAASLELVARIIATDRPVVLDADGLRALNRHRGILPRAATTVLTPHPGEMSRLMEALELTGDDRHVQAIEVAERLGAIVVLKGRGTVIASPAGRVIVNSTGTPGLASGGSGDVLTGMVAAFLCQVADPVDAVALAVFLHGLASEMAPTGHRNLVPDDLPDLLGLAMRRISPFA